MLVIVFENQLKAYEGSNVLAQLDSEVSISVHAEAVIKKNDDGNVTIEQKGEDFPIRPSVEPQWRSDRSSGRTNRRWL